MSARPREELQWLMDLFGPEELAEISRLGGEPTAEQRAVLAALEAEPMPATSAIFATTDADLPAAVGRLLAQEATR
jgi:hypothetical protein